jgi:flagellar protein FlaI
VSVSAGESTAQVPVTDEPAASAIESLLTRLGNIESQRLRDSLAIVLDNDRETKPAFSSSWVLPIPPPQAQLVKSYPIGDAEVRLYRLPDRTESLYFVAPFEYSLDSRQLKLLCRAREELRALNPGKVELRTPQEARMYAVQVGEEMLAAASKRDEVNAGKDKSEEKALLRRLASVLARYTTGLGVIEIPLADPNVQDVYIDAPNSRCPVHLVLGAVDGGLSQRCVTNIRLTEGDAESLLSRFRFESGRPFSEAMPVLETNLDEFKSRVTAIGRPLSPHGLAMAIRRHSTEPWTLPRLIAARSLTPFAAGLLSFLIDGRCTILVAGSRGAGKTSLLGALMLELPQSQRILTIEDTLELPTTQMQMLGYKVQNLFVQSSLGGLGEMTADEALRVSLRLGESALVLGEVRGQEARTLYEAMRAGTAGSSVLGTIHGNSSKAVYERIVHDMGIPPMAFAATDVIVIAGLARPGGTQRQLRRVTEITELAKSRGPGEFSSLMAYEPKVDELRGVDRVLWNSEKICSIAAQWGLSTEETMENIRIRGECKRRVVAESIRRADPSLLGARFVAAANAKYWSLVESGLAGDVLLSEWTSWLAGGR